MYTKSPVSVEILCADNDREHVYTAEDHFAGKHSEIHVIGSQLIGEILSLTYLIHL